MAIPLKRGYSKASVGSNIKKLTAEGKPKAQAVAIALSVARKAAVKAGKPSKAPARPRRKTK